MLGSLLVRRPRCSGIWRDCQSISRRSSVFRVRIMTFESKSPTQQCLRYLERHGSSLLWAIVPISRRVYAHVRHCQRAVFATCRTPWSVRIYCLVVTGLIANFPCIYKVAEPARAAPCGVARILADLQQRLTDVRQQPCLSYVNAKLRESCCLRPCHLAVLVDSSLIDRIVLLWTLVALYRHHDHIAAVSC